MPEKEILPFPVRKVLARGALSRARVSRRLAETSVASAASRRGSITFRHLLDDDLTLHAGTLVRLAVELVGTSLVELVAHLFARAVQVVLVGDRVGVDAIRNGVFVEDDVVRERLVVDEFNRFTSLDRDGRRLFIGKSRASVSLRARSSSSSSTRAGSPRVRIGRRALTVSRGSLGGVRRVARASRRVASRRVGSRT